MGWLEKTTRLRDEEGIEIVAVDEPKLWTIFGRPYEAEDVSSTMASGKVLCSPALAGHLEKLGWPGNLKGFNYYNADKLRKELEEIFPDPARPLLDDPDWPDCWGGHKNCPAMAVEALREASNVPATERQLTVLQFFGVESDGVTKGEASALIDELFSDPEKMARWDRKKSKEFSGVPATDKQMVRLRFAARTLGKQLPDRLSKQHASDLIDDWYGENDALEAAYQQFKEDEIEREFEEYERENREEEKREFRQPARQSPRAVFAAPKTSGCLGVIVFGVFLVGTGIFSAIHWLKP